MSLDEQVGKLREVFNNTEKLLIDNKAKAQVYYLLGRAMLIAAEISTDVSGKTMLEQIDDVVRLSNETKRYIERARELDPTESYRTIG